MRRMDAIDRRLDYLDRVLAGHARDEDDTFPIRFAPPPPEDVIIRLRDRTRLLDDAE